jgi:signal transduction histidine kinase
VTATTGEEVAEDHITSVEPISLQNRRIGTLVLLYDLARVGERTRLFSAIVIIVVVLSILIAYLLSSRLRTLIATPIARLATVATSVSETKDYSLRADKFTSDELGILVDAFNEMLAGIQSRDNNLRKALLDVQKSNERLERSNEDLERFAFIASHDLQEPLRMIAVYSQLLVKHYASGIDDQGSMFVGNIVGGTKRMRDLLADLLAYTEINARPDRPFEIVDLNKVVDTVRENLKMVIEENDVVVTTDRLPSITAYESHFISLFQNLIGNAIKYRSERPPRVHISAQETNGDLRLAVEDNGIGIEEKYHGTIFTAFKRLHGQNIPGTGIGLAICQRVVERYGGRIWVESELGHGASFLFTLPKNGPPGGELNG